MKPTDDQIADIARRANKLAQLVDEAVAAAPDEYIAAGIVAALVKFIAMRMRRRLDGETVRVSLGSAVEIGCLEVEAEQP